MPPWGVHATAPASVTVMPVGPVTRRYVSAGAGISASVSDNDNDKDKGASSLTVWLGKAERTVADVMLIVLLPPEDMTRKEGSACGVLKKLSVQNPAALKSPLRRNVISAKGAVVLPGMVCAVPSVPPTRSKVTAISEVLNELTGCAPWMLGCASGSEVWRGIWVHWVGWLPEMPVRNEPFRNWAEFWGPANLTLWIFGTLMPRPPETPT